VVCVRFSTTTRTDRAVASIGMMALGTMQNFFDYKMLVGCGFPSVTFPGKKRAWEDISRRVDELKGMEGG